MVLFSKEKVILSLCIVSLFFSCTSVHFKSIITEDNSNLLVTDSELIESAIKPKYKQYNPSAFEKYLIQQNFIRIRDYNKAILVSLKYATNQNFMHRNMYGSFREGYLRKEVALKLISAQHLLEKIKPGYKLIVYDAVRPLSIQKLMWDSVNVPSNVKYKYLSNPKFRSLHNYGAAVDVSIVDDKGYPLDMGTPFDCFCELAYPYFEKKFLKIGLLTPLQYQNRLLLRNIMEKNHFSGISTEWWHFNYCSRKYAERHFTLIKSFDTTETHLLINETLESHNNITRKEKISDQRIRFRVQIATSTHKISTSDKMFKNLKVWQYFHQGLYKYTVGCFTDLNKAINYRNKIRKLGFSDCFIAAFDDSERISIKDAFAIIKD